MRPFVVDIFRTDSKNNVSKRRLQADNLEIAKHLMEVYKETGDVTRRVVSERVGTRYTRLEKKCIWTRGI